MCIFVLHRSDRFIHCQQHQNAGLATPVALMIILLLLLLGGAAINDTNTDLQMSTNYRAHTQAFWVAEAGLNRTIARMNEDPGWLASVTDPMDAFPQSGSPSNSIGNGRYTVQLFVDDPTPGQIRIVSTGRLNNGKCCFIG